MTKPEVPTKRRTTRSKTVVIKSKEDLLDETPRDINGAIVNNPIKANPDSENHRNEKDQSIDHSCQKHYQEEPKYCSNEISIRSGLEKMSITPNHSTITDYTSDANDDCKKNTSFSNRPFNPIDQTETVTKSLSKPRSNVEFIKQRYLEANRSVLKTNDGLYKKKEESNSRTFCFSELMSAFQTIEKKVQEDPYIAHNLLKKFKGTEEQYSCDNSNGFKTEKLSFPSIRNNPFMQFNYQKTAVSPIRML